MSPHTRIPCLVLAAALFATSASAHWPQSSSVDVGSTGAAYGPQGGRVIPDPDGTGFFTLFVSKSGLGTWGWRVNHLDSDGHTTWPSAVDLNGGADGSAAFNDDMAGPGFAALGHGASLNVWCQSGRVLLNAADSTGNFPLWDPSRGRDTLATFAGVQSHEGIETGACSREGDGGFVAWSRAGPVWLLRVDEMGRRAAGWPTGGWKLPVLRAPTTSFPQFMDLASDGAGGVLLAFVDNHFTPRLQRITSDTAFAVGWPAAGVALSPSMTLTSWFRFVRSGPAHVLVVWFEAVDQTCRIRCQRIGLDGQRDPGWPTEGVVVAAPGAELLSLACVEDGAGGTTIGWCAIGGPAVGGYEVRRVRVDGTSPGLYEGGSVWVSSGESAGLARGVGQGAVVLVPDPADLAGIRGVWLDGDGVSADCEPQETCHVALQPSGSPALAALSDGAGGAYYLWSRGTGQYNFTVAASHADYLGIATTSVPPPATASLALSLSPNPAHGSLVARFALADDRPARLELLDIAGRRVRAIEVRGSGAHAERLDGLGAFAPGVYLVRVTHGAEVQTARAVIVR